MKGHFHIRCECATALAASVARRQPSTLLQVDAGRGFRSMNDQQEQYFFTVLRCLGGANDFCAKEYTGT